MKNLEIAKLLYEIADILELMEVQWEPRAYRNAARSVEALAEDIEEVAKRGELKEIPGVGKSIEQSILEFLKTGRIGKLEDLKKKSTIDVSSLLSIPGLGPKKIKMLSQKLKIRTVDDLEAAAKAGKLRMLEGMGELSEKKILDAIRSKVTKKVRMPLGYVMPVADEIRSILEDVGGVKSVDVVGSYRRRKETVGDLDVLVVSRNVKDVMDAFTGMKSVGTVTARGPSRAAVRLSMGMNVDLRVVKEGEYGSAMQYFTGSTEHSVELRKIAISKGLKLSEYGLFNRKTGRKVAGRTEEEVYHKLGLQYVPPELRENLGEIEAARKKALPKLVEEKDVRADFQMHTTWSDGNDSMEEMVAVCEGLGHKAIAFTDHLGPLKIANALDAKRFSKYIAAIEKAAKKTGVRIFKGAEIDVLKDGSLSATKAQLKQLDYVLASVHSSFAMGEAEMTKRVVDALENYPITTLAHPTARLLNKREGVALNMEKVFDAAKRTDTFLEIDCHPERMDLDGSMIKGALEAGCRFAIGSDSHGKNSLHFIALGAALARRGWATSQDVLNCWPVKKIEKALKK